ncbi:hypothetical protein [Rhodoferax sediminis]|uniref:hypothetical protein n=1 Tax=Rhodoferax sediminis TaxID=2509614 RepID=UPI00143DC771|nr:hypothetical protein [Rhodoferax sediminis]
MTTYNSPFENLAAFVIAFAGGAISAISLIQYIAKVRRDERRARPIGSHHESLHP